MFMPAHLQVIDSDSPGHLKENKKARVFKDRFIKLTNGAFTSENMIWHTVKASALKFNIVDGPEMAAFKKQRDEEAKALAEESA